MLASSHYRSSDSTIVGVADLQVIEHVPVLPFEVRAVIVAVPACIAVTFPVLLIVATQVLLDDQVTDWLAFDG